MEFLTENLPEPFNGFNECLIRRYTEAIDNGQGQEVHDAILTLLREETA